MSKIKLTVALSATVFLAACGGGGRDSADSAPKPSSPVVPSTPSDPVTPLTPTYYTPQTLHTEDTFDYSNTRTASGASIGLLGTSSYTSQVGLFAPDGSHYLNRIVKGLVTENALFNSHNELVRLNGCTFTPAFSDMPMPFYVGQTFKQTSTAACTSTIGLPQLVGIPSTVTVDSSVQSYEKVAVTAGKFNAVKIKTDTRTAFNTGVVSHESKTCWQDVISGVTVKCVGTVTYDTLHVTSPSLSATLNSLGLTPETNNLVLALVRHGYDFPVNLRASIDDVSVPSVYVTSFENAPIDLEQGKTLTLNTSDGLVWSIRGAEPRSAQYTLLNGVQVLTVDGYQVSLTNTGEQKIVVKVITAPPKGIGSFYLYGGTFADTNITVGVIVHMGEKSSPLPTNCGAAYFC